MSWYSTGTATFTNSSTTVTGTGTNWMQPNAQVGDAIHAPDGAVYEITAVVSATEITIAPAYQATTVAGAAYRIQPTRGVLANLLAQIATLLTNFQAGVDGILAGRFPDGNAATPALRFLADEDTGLFRKGGNKIGFAVGGQEAGYIDSDLRLRGPMVTPALTPDTISDLDSHTMVPGYYGVISSTPGTRPPGASSFGFLLVFRQAVTGILQYYINSNGAVMAYRTATSGVWSAWITLYSTNNILGTVSQSGGVPTGAVIERGSNANGEFERFAGGLQICTNGNAAITTSPAAFTGTITKIDGDKLWIGSWN